MHVSMRLAPTNGECRVVVDSDDDEHHSHGHAPSSVRMMRQRLTIAAQQHPLRTLATIVLAVVVSLMTISSLGDVLHHSGGGQHPIAASILRVASDRLRAKPEEEQAPEAEVATEPQADDAAIEATDAEEASNGGNTTSLVAAARSRVAALRRAPPGRASSPPRRRPPLARLRLGRRPRRRRRPGDSHGAP